MSIVRETMNTINWESKLVAIRGSRGVGKTTLMRQYIRQKYGTSAGKALYCAMDSMYFSSHGLLDLAENFLIDGKTVIKVGGKDKSFSQIANIDNSYVLADDIELPVGKKIPIWIVGMEY